MKRVLVLGAGGAAGINFSRSMRRAGGFHAIGCDLKPERLAMGQWDQTVASDRADSPEHLNTVLRVIEQTKPDILYAQADSEVFWLSANRSRLPVPCLLPAETAIEASRDKLALSGMLAAHGVDVPAGMLADEANELSFRRLLDISGKVWVRARSGAGSKAALPVKSLEMSRMWVRYWCESRGLKSEDFMLCEFLPGAEFAWQGVFKDGRLLAGVTRERLEYVFAEQMPSGQSSTPSKARIVHNATVTSLGERAVRAIDPMPSGVYGVDMKSDAAGNPRVTEINVGRFYTTSDFYAAAGCNLVEIYLRAGLGLPLPDCRVHDPIPAGATWIRSLDAAPKLFL